MSFEPMLHQIVSLQLFVLFGAKIMHFSCVKIETSSDCANLRNIIVHYLGILLCKFNRSVIFEFLDLDIEKDGTLI